MLSKRIQNKAKWPAENVNWTKKQIKKKRNENQPN